MKTSIICPDASMPELQGQLDHLEDLAFQGAELPEDLAYPEQLLFLRFRFLYAYARLTQMDSTQGKREKETILTAYLAEKLNYDLCQKIIREHERSKS